MNYPLIGEIIPENISTQIRYNINGIKYGFWLFTFHNSYSGHRAVCIFCDGVINSIINSFEVGPTISNDGNWVYVADSIVSNYSASKSIRLFNA